MAAAGRSQSRRTASRRRRPWSTSGRAWRGFRGPRYRGAGPRRRGRRSRRAAARACVRAGRCRGATRRSRLASGMLRVWLCFSARRSSSTSPAIWRIRVRVQQCANDRTIGRSRRGGSTWPARRDASAALHAARPAPVTGASPRSSSTTVSVCRYFARVVAPRSGCERNASIAAARSTPDAMARRSAGRLRAMSRGVVLPARRRGSPRARRSASPKTCRLRARPTWRVGAHRPAPARPQPIALPRLRGERALPRDPKYLLRRVWCALGTGRWLTFRRQRE